MKLCLTGDVMCGRGIDQILRHPGDPEIHERGARTALDYVALAERRSGPLPRRVDPAYVWGDTLPVVEQASPDAFIVNLETAVTDRGAPWPRKGIHYRMHPANTDVLAAAGMDVAVLANNHVLDWSTVSPRAWSRWSAPTTWWCCPCTGGRTGVTRSARNTSGSPGA